MTRKGHSENERPQLVAPRFRCDNRDSVSIKQLALALHGVLVMADSCTLGVRLAMHLSRGQHADDFLYFATRLCAVCRHRCPDATAAALVGGRKANGTKAGGGRPHELLDPRLGVKRFQRDCRKAIPTVEKSSRH